MNGISQKSNANPSATGIGYRKGQKSFATSTLAVGIDFALLFPFLTGDCFTLCSVTGENHIHAQYARAIPSNANAQDCGMCCARLKPHAEGIGTKSGMLKIPRSTICVMASRLTNACDSCKLERDIGSEANVNVAALSEDRNSEPLLS